MGWTYLIDFAVVIIFGGAVGLGEIVSRYKDEPGSVLGTKPALLYLLVNGVLSAFALGFICIYSWSANPDNTKASSPPAVKAEKKLLAEDGVAASEVGETVASRCTRVLIAGFAAMAFFRSALFSVRISGRDVSVGPVLFFQSILAAIDANVDRLRGLSRINRVTAMMQGVDFKKAQSTLTMVCFGLLQNASPEEVARLSKVVSEISANKTTDNSAKSLLLGLALMNLMGEDLLDTIVAKLKTAKLI